MPDTRILQILDRIRILAHAANVFARVDIQPTSAGPILVAAAANCPSRVEYRVESDAAGRIWVSLVTPDRWMSESIEADLMHTGDDLEDLLEEEFADQDLDFRLPFEHFRSEDRFFTFRSAVPPAPAASTSIDSDAARIARCLLAYEACFRELGDVAAGVESDDANSSA